MLLSFFSFRLFAIQKLTFTVANSFLFFDLPWCFSLQHAEYMHTVKRIKYIHKLSKVMESALLTLYSKICWANELSQPLFIIIDLQLSACVTMGVCVCVFGRCLTFLFFSFDFTWPQFTCRLPLNVASPYKYPHVHMHTQKRQHTLYLLLPICAPAYISCLPLTLSYLHTHTHTITPRVLHMNNTLLYKSCPKV